MSHSTDEKTLVEMLFRRDDTVIARILDFYGYELTAVISRKYGLHISFVQDVVTDSIIQLWQNPEKYDPTKSSLKTFLARDAEYDLLNVLEKEKRQKESAVLVELEPNTRNIETGEDPTRLIFSETMEVNIRRFLASIFPNALDQQLAWLIEIEQIRETSLFAEELEIEHLSLLDQELEVKRTKDRIKAQLKRKGWAKFKGKLKQDA